MTDNALELSDEEFEKLDPSQLEQPTNEEPEDGLQEEREEETNEVEDTESEEATEEAVEASESDSEEEPDTEVEETVESSPEASEKPTEAIEEEAKEIDYKSLYESLFQPFKANGKEMKIDSIDDARQLMQMGANYNKKMAALKPNLKVIKTLEKNNLLNDDDINYLIDLKNKNPEAIRKLLKDSEIDPLDIDTSSETEYKPNNYSTNDKEIELDGILEEIQETESFNKTIDILGKKWDEKSKQVIVDNPQLIKVINDHVGNGIYDQISSVVERERMLGRLSGLSDIEAYRQVGDQLNAHGAFNKQSQSTVSQPNVEVPNNKVDPKLASRKKSASTTKSKSAVKQQPDFNPLSMSDEEFEKVVMDKYI